MSNHDTAQKVKDMSADQRGQVKKNLYGIIFKSLAVLALLGVAGVFLTADDAGTELARYQNEGVVSQALVVAMDEGNKVRVVHTPESTTPFAALGDTVQVADLPVPTAGASTGTVIMTTDGFTHVKVGDVITVVNTPYEPAFPKTLESITAEPSNSYLIWMAVLAVLAVALWMIGRAASKR